jgi:elongation factor G
MQDTHSALMTADVAVVVCEPEVERALGLAPLLHLLDSQGIPHMIFINKMDAASMRVREILDALQSVSARPLVLREVPIRDGDSISGYADLVSERAYTFKSGASSDLIPLPESASTRYSEARQTMLESLADFDDALLEQLLEDVVPSKEEIYQHLTKDFQADSIVPVFLGAAELCHRVRRLMKALRHEVADFSSALARLGLPAGEPLIGVFKTYHLPHTGKISLARIWRGETKDGEHFGDQRVSGLYQMKGHTLEKTDKAVQGDVVALGRLEGIHTGAVIGAGGVIADALDWPEPLKPVYSLTIEPKKREDEVKLSAAITRLIDEDGSLSIEHNQDTNELVLWEQGKIHLQVTAERFESLYNVSVSTRQPQIPYKETIRKPVKQHARHRKQSGGNGQFGDVHLDIKPLARGAGFNFDNSIVGGAVPKQYIPSVESGVREYLQEGALGFPIVDLSVSLVDGQFHAVDSSDMAFKIAAILAMKDGLPKADPVLLEPICRVKISVSNSATSKAQGMITKRRGQILGFDAKIGWKSWDEVEAFVPQSELHDMIIELCSVTHGVVTYEWGFDPLSELSGRLPITSSRSDRPRPRPLRATSLRQ